jgi:copper chaperone
MQHYRVPDMTCGHCSSTIEKAVKAIDPNALVSIDLARRQVSVQTSAEAARIADAIRHAGYGNEAIAA